jgi:hypothetical protein
MDFKITVVMAIMLRKPPGPSAVPSGSALKLKRSGRRRCASLRKSKRRDGTVRRPADCRAGTDPQKRALLSYELPHMRRHCTARLSRNARHRHCLPCVRRVRDLKLSTYRRAIAEA